MHAKQGQQYLTPQDVAGGVRLAQPLRTLWAYLRELIERHLRRQACGSSLSP